MTTNPLDIRPAETHAQQLARQQAALCRFAGAVEKLTKMEIRDSEALHLIRAEVRKMNQQMDWGEM